MTLYLGENLISGVATPIEGARNIGQIIQSTIPLSDAGLHLLDGALISGSGSYADFVTYIAGLVSTYPDLFETEANWQTSVTNYGVCGKFVYDSVNNTVRLPKITGFTEGTLSSTSLGNLTEAGLPNITSGYWYGVYANYDTTEVAGSAIRRAGDYHSDSNVSSGDYRSNYDLDASRSSSIYGNSSTVQPQSIKVLYYIVIATSTKTDIEVDIDEIVTDLNGKADIDLSNTNLSTFATKMNTAGIRTVIETYSNGTNWYRIYSDGWCEQGGTTNYSTTPLTINLFVEMQDTNYTALAIEQNPSGGCWAQITGKSTTTVSVGRFYASGSSGGAGAGRDVNWEVKGYKSSGA